MMIHRLADGDHWSANSWSAHSPDIAFGRRMREVIMSSFYVFDCVPAIMEEVDAVTSTLGGASLAW